MTLTVTTWNVNGARGLDIEPVAEHVRSTGTDVLALQEVQRHQARALARTLDARTLVWGYKHWPWRTWPEGMALVGVTLPIGGVRTKPITARWRLANHRRRIVQLGELAHPDADGTSLGLVNVHLSPGRPETAGRERELADILGRLTGRNRAPWIVMRHASWIIAGDLNAERDERTIDQLTSAGFTSGEPALTKWRRGPSDRRPERQIDYVWVSEGLAVTETSAPRHGDDGFATFAALSDHLPLTATMTVDA